MSRNATLTKEDVETYRMRIRAARESKSRVCLLPDELRLILDAYETMKRANMQLLDYAYPTKEVKP